MNQWLVSRAFGLHAVTPGSNPVLASGLDFRLSRIQPELTLKS